MRIRHGLSLGLGVALIAALTGAGWGQTTTATATGAKVTMVLDYHDVPADTMLQEVAVRLGIIIVKNKAIADKVTLVSGKPVDADEAAVLINEALWSLGYRAWGGKTDSDPAKAKLMIMIEKRPTVKNPGEIWLWRPEPPARLPLDIPEEMPGVSDKATMKFNYINATLGKVLQDMGTSYGFATEAAEQQKRQVSIIAPEELRAREAMGLVNELMAGSGYGLQIEKVDDGKGGKKTLMRVITRKETRPKLAATDFRYEQAPLQTVLDEVAKRSGYPVVNQAGKDVRVTIRKVIEADGKGMADMGAVIAALNETLLPEGVVIELTSRVGGGGKQETILRALKIEEAKKTILPRPAGEQIPIPNEKDFVNVDLKKKVPCRYENTDVTTVLSDMTAHYGVIVLVDGIIPERKFTILVSEMNALDAAGLVNSIVMTFGYLGVVLPSKSMQKTALWVMDSEKAKPFLKPVATVTTTPVVP